MSEFKHCARGITLRIITIVDIRAHILFHGNLPKVCTCMYIYKMGANGNPSEKNEMCISIAIEDRSKDTAGSDVI